MATQDTPGRRCVFCGAEIAEDAPPEHVLPKWLQKFRKKGESFEHGPRTFESVGHCPEKSESHEHFSGRSKYPQLTVRTVCTDCNHHWMSDLETWASPILTPMIEGESQGLDLARQLLLSRWIVKTAMMWDQMVPAHNRSFQPDAYRWLKEKPTPPPDTTIRLARCPEPRGDFVDMKHENLFIDVEPDAEVVHGADADGHRMPIVIGQLVMEVTVSRRSEPLLRPVDGNLAELADEAFITIWPSVETTSWPPRYGLSSGTLDSFMAPKRVPPADGA